MDIALCDVDVSVCGCGAYLEGLGVCDGTCFGGVDVVETNQWLLPL